MNRKLFPLLYDAVAAPMDRLGLNRWRAGVVAAARGRVLEVGAGTGRNLRFYRHATRIVLTDPDRAMLIQAGPRIGEACCPVHLVVADAEAIPFADGSFDSAVSTLAFCTIPHPACAFEEIHRVLIPGGTLHLLEHVRTERPWVAGLQDALTPAWRQIGRGCHLNRRPLETAQAHGFITEEVRRGFDGWLLAASLRAVHQP